MSTLADEVLADMANEDEQDIKEEPQNGGQQGGGQQGGGQQGGGQQGGGGGQQLAQDQHHHHQGHHHAHHYPHHAHHSLDTVDSLKPSRITEVVHLRGCDRLLNILKKIESFVGPNTIPGGVGVNVTSSTAASRKQNFLGDVDPEYDLIVSSNEMAADLQNEISVIHKFIRDLYSKKFPELEQLVLHPLDYARIVRRIGNDTSSAIIQALSDILPQTNIMTISMAASSSTGEDLDTKTELDAVNEACDIAFELDDARQKILSYVEGRMQVFAPNLTAIVGSEIATKLIGIAGGLNKLANMPSANLFVLGKKRANLEGFSSATTVKHHGYVAYCDIVKNTPSNLEIKACRLVANKCSLAARLDLAREHNQGQMGHKFREEIEKKIEKWQEPPPKKKEKVLPAPDDLPRKRRGGARMRKYKQRYAMTEMRKRAMRLPFGKITEDQGNTMVSLGMLGMEGSGKVRANAREDKGFQPKVKRRKTQKGGNQSTVGGGFSTSVYAMTPVQGLELPAPTEAKDAASTQDATDGYFSTTGGFLHVGRKRKNL